METGQDRLEILRQALASCIGQYEGLLTSPEVIAISQELDKLIVELMCSPDKKACRREKK